MTRYIALVSKDENSAYGVTFPDVPGAFAAADTWDDVPEAANEALALWFEGTPDAADSYELEVRPLK